MIRALIMLIVSACAYQGQQTKHEEAATEQTTTDTTKDDPSYSAELIPPSYSGQPIEDRISKITITGAKTRVIEDWEKTAMGADEHVDVKASVGPTGLASTIGWFVLAGGGLGIVGFVLWKLKPPFLNFIWSRLKK